MVEIVIERHLQGWREQSSSANIGQPDYKQAHTTLHITNIYLTQIAVEL